MAPCVPMCCRSHSSSDTMGPPYNTCKCYTRLCRPPCPLNPCRPLLHRPCGWHIYSSRSWEADVAVSSRLFAFRAQNVILPKFCKPHFFKRGDYWSGHRKNSQLAIDPATGTIAIRLFIRLILFLSFCYAHKRPSPFFLYIPTKTLFSTIKYELTTEFLSANG